MQQMICLGNLGRDPEIKETKNGKEICVFSVGVPTGYGDHKTTEWFNCIAFGNTGRAIGKYLQKGSQILIQGEMRNSPYRKDENGHDIQNFTLNVSQFSFVGNKKSEGNPSYNDTPASFASGSNNSSDEFMSVGNNSDEEDLPF